MLSDVELAAAVRALDDWLDPREEEGMLLGPDGPIQGTYVVRDWMISRRDVEAARDVLRREEDDRAKAP